MEQAAGCDAMSTAPTVPMFSPDGSLKQVPNHLVDVAAKAGGQPAIAIITPDGEKKYAPKNRVRQLVAMGAKLAPISDKVPSPPGSPLSRFLSAAIAPFKGAVESFNGNATPDEQKQGLTSFYDEALRPFERAVSSQIQEAHDAQDLAGNGQYSRAAGHAIASVVPLVGPYVAEATEDYYNKLANGDVAGALGSASGNTALVAAPEVVKKGAKIVSPAFRKGLQSLSGASSAVPELVEKTTENNRVGAEKSAEDQAKHQEAVKNAEHETRGRETAHQYEVQSKANEIEQSEASDAAKQNAEHQKAVRETAEHNARVNAKHEAVSKRIQEENQAAEKTLDLRRQQEASLNDATKQYYEQEDAAKAKAKTEENAAWAPWRQMMKAVTIDGGEIVKRLKSIMQGSPEVTRVLRQLQPAAEDAAPDSLYAQDRAAIMKAQGFKGNYFDYPPNVRGQIDQIAQSSGFEPEPIDFDPEAGKQIPVDQIHRVQSILDNNIRNGRFEGPLLGEMKQAAKALRAAVTKASADAGALQSLDAAREATRKYQDAFGKQRHLPTTQDEIREKQANPEAYKEREDEGRLKKTAAYDPTLVDSYRQVKQARENLRKLPTEDQLRKGQKQVPAPPSVNDYREGYRLRPEPTPPQKRLTSGSPTERAAQSVRPPERVSAPEAPKPFSPQLIGDAEIQEAKKIALEKKADWIRHRGAWIASWPIFEAMRAMWDGHFPAIPGMAMESMGTLGMVHLAANLLERPESVKFLTSATEHDIAQVPPDLRGTMPRIVKVAQARGMKVSPALLAAFGAAGHPRHPVLSSQSPVQ